MQKIKQTVGVEGGQCPIAGDSNDRVQCRGVSRSAMWSGVCRSTASCCIGLLYGLSIVLCASKHSLYRILACNSCTHGECRVKVTGWGATQNSSRGYLTFQRTVQVLRVTRSCCFVLTVDISTSWRATEARLSWWS